MQTVYSYSAGAGAGAEAGERIRIRRRTKTPAMSFRFICSCSWCFWCSSSAFHSPHIVLLCAWWVSVVRRMCWRFGLKVACSLSQRPTRTEEGRGGKKWARVELKGKYSFIFVSLSGDTDEHQIHSHTWQATMPMHASQLPSQSAIHPSNHPLIHPPHLPKEHMNINWIIVNFSVSAAIANYFGHFCSHIIIFSGTDE